MREAAPAVGLRAILVDGLSSLLVGWTLGPAKFRRTAVVAGQCSFNSIKRSTAHSFVADQPQEA